MLSIIKNLCLVGCVLLAGCITPPIKYAPNNPVNNERIQSALITYQTPASIPLAYSVPIGYRVDRTQSPAKDELGKQAHSDTQTMLLLIGKQVPLQLSNALTKRGVKNGADATISLRPISAHAGWKGVVRLHLEVTVRTSDRTKPQWVMEIGAIGRDIDTGIDPSGEKMAALYTTQIISELARAGFIAAE